MLHVCARCGRRGSSSRQRGKRICAPRRHAPPRTHARPQVCLDNSKDTMLQCGHVVCGSCVRVLRTCPTCQTKVVHSKTRKIYL